MVLNLQWNLILDVVTYTAESTTINQALDFIIENQNLSDFLAK